MNESKKPPKKSVLESPYLEPKQKPLALGTEVLQSLFENGKSPLSVQFIRWKLWKMWPDYVGDSLAKNSEPVGYYRGTLYLWVKNASWMQQIQFMRDHIRDAINKKLQMQYVQDVRLTLDRRSVPVEAAAQSELREAISRIVPESQDQD